MKIINRILTAFRFLTIIPIPRLGKPALEEFGKSMAFFPLVGAVLGAGLVCIAGGLVGHVSNFLSATILVALWGWITGALHLEGFVDAADGFSASSDKDRILAVMKDVHCGAKGVVAVVFLIALRIALVYDICLGGRWVSFMVVPAIGRWAMVWVASTCPYGGKTEGLGLAFTKDAGILELLISTSTLLIIGCALLKWKFFLLMLFPVAFSLLAIMYIRRKFNGVTGDILGALNEIAEVVGLATILLWKI